MHSISPWALPQYSHTNTVSLVDLASGTVAQTISVGNAPRKLVIQPGPAAQPRAAQPSTEPTGAGQPNPPVSNPTPTRATAALPAGTVAATVSITKFNFPPAHHVDEQ